MKEWTKYKPYDITKCKMQRFTSGCSLLLMIRRTDDMPVIKGLDWTFDTVAATYEKFRPGYPDALYKMLFAYIPIHRSSHVVEVGIGGGQATLPILKTGCSLTAVEPGENFSKLCGKKFEEYKNFSLITEKFENTSFPQSQYDLVYSASAFHWVPEEIGYSKAYDMLKHGGAFARFANHPYRDKGNPPLSARIDALYSTYYDEYYGKERKPQREYGEKEAIHRAQLAEKYGFTDISHAMFYRTRAFSARDYTRLLGTYSDHIAIEEKVRTEFFAKIEEAINQYGGTFTIYDTIDLRLARKP